MLTECRINYARWFDKRAIATRARRPTEAEACVDGRRMDCLCDDDRWL